MLSLGQDYIKIPSGEITNGHLLSHINKKRKKVLLSTGASSINDIENAINELTNIKNITLMQCINCLSNKIN